jgi:predicted AAA+ superfamily ATPase
MDKVYPRKLKKRLLEEIEHPEIVLLTGMRQVGKTTLIKDIFNHIQSDNKIYIDLENPLNQIIFEEKNFDNIIYNLAQLGLNPKDKMYIFLDEIQLVPEIVKPIKYIYDNYNVKFFLTGSSSFYLKNLFPESLAGRKVLYELFPLDFEEFLIFKEKARANEEVKSFEQKTKMKNRISYSMFIKLFEEYMTYGGFPRVVIEGKLERRKLIIEDIFKSYFEKDVKTLSDFKEIGRLRDTILLLAGRVGSKLEISKIALEVGVSRETIYSYINFLEKTYFIFLISPIARNINGEVRGAKKIYFCDTGILNQIGKVTEGALFENAVFLNLKKFGKINYYQRYKGPEIDFILNETIGFEVKLNARSADITKLKRVAESIKLTDYYLISKDFVDGEKIIVATVL